MRNKLYMALTTLTLTCVLLLTARAQAQAKLNSDSLAAKKRPALQKVKLTCDMKRAAESSTVVISNSTARSLPARSLVSWTVNFYGDGTQHKQPGFRARLKKNDGNGIVRTLQGQIYACNAWTYVN